MSNEEEPIVSLSHSELHSESESEEDEESEELAPRVFSRGNRGKRTGAIVVAKDDDDEEADSFWGSAGAGGELFKDADHDSISFDEEDQAEEDGEDDADSDFDTDEKAPTNAEVDAEGEKADMTAKKQDRLANKKKAVYVDPARKPKAKATKAQLQASDDMETDMSPKAKKPRTTKPIFSQQAVEDRKRSMRGTTRSTVKESEDLREMEQQLAKAKKRTRRKVEHYQPTQQEILAECKITRKHNKETLLELMRYEEEKKRVVVVKNVNVGPMMIFSSSNTKGNTLTLTQIHSLPPQFTSGPIQYPQKNVCAVYGTPAKYLDPLTNKYYSNVDAFKQIRKQYDSFLSLTLIHRHALDEQERLLAEKLAPPKPATPPPVIRIPSPQPALQTNPQPTPQASPQPTPQILAQPSPQQHIPPMPSTLVIHPPYKPPQKPPTSTTPVHSPQASPVGGPVKRGRGRPRKRKLDEMTGEPIEVQASPPPKPQIPAFVPFALTPKGAKKAAPKTPKSGPKQTTILHMLGSKPPTPQLPLVFSPPLSNGADTKPAPPDNL